MFWKNDDYRKRSDNHKLASKEVIGLIYKAIRGAGVNAKLIGKSIVVEEELKIRLQFILKKNVDKNIIAYSVPIVISPKTGRFEDFEDNWVLFDLETLLMAFPEAQKFPISIHNDEADNGSQLLKDATHIYPELLKILSTKTTLERFANGSVFEIQNHEFSIEAVENLELGITQEGVISAVKAI